MIRVFAICLTAAALVGCATSPDAAKGTGWEPTCLAMGCIESGLALQVPVGAELTFSQCMGLGRSTYGYVRKPAGWTLVSRTAEVDRVCTPEDSQLRPLTADPGARSPR